MIIREDNLPEGRGLRQTFPIKFGRNGSLWQSSSPLKYACTLYHEQGFGRLQTSSLWQGLHVKNGNCSSSLLTVLLNQRAHPQRFFPQSSDVHCVSPRDQTLPPSPWGGEQDPPSFMLLPCLRHFDLLSPNPAGPFWAPGFSGRELFPVLTPGVR